MWQYFDYVSSSDNGVCNIANSKGVQRGTLVSGTNPTNLKTPRFLSSKMSSQSLLSAEAAVVASTSTATDKAKIKDPLKNLVADFKHQITVQRQQQSAEVEPEVDYDNALNFWRPQRRVYTELVDVAEDLISSPASQTYVERVFSVCGLLTAGRRNRMNKSLQMRVFLKLNHSICTETILFHWLT